MPNLPYLIYDGVTVTENDSVCRIAAARYKPELLGVTIQEKALVENYFCAATKINPKIRGPICFKTPISSDKERQEAADQGKELYAGVEQRLAKNKWIASAGQSIADIYFWELNEAMTLLCPTFINSYTEIKRWKADFEKEKWLVDFKASGRFVEKPFYPPNATINNI